MNPSTDLHPAGPGPAAKPGTPHSVQDLLARACAVAERDFGDSDMLNQAVLHLLECANQAVTCLPNGDLDAARSALASARSAVVAATYAVRMMHGQGEGVPA